MSAKCPHCDANLLTLNLTEASASSMMGVELRAIVYSCSSCQKALNASIDPIAINAENYSLVAAGTVRSTDMTGENTINRLRAVGVKKGEITLTFDGYRMPDASTRYIVKAQIMAGPALKLPIPMVRLIEFRPEGFTLRVTRGATLLTITEIRQLEFIIEVSRY